MLPPIDNPYLLPNPSLLSFSGGRTSGYLVKQVLDAHDGNIPFYIIPVFCNTGRENEYTLEFVEELSNRYKVKVYWVEYLRDESKKPAIWDRKMKRWLMGQHAYRLVDFKTASRNGEPFSQLIDALAAYRLAKGESPVLPNVVQRICSSQLKIRSSARFMNESLKIDTFNAVLGIRYDEPSRAAGLLGACNGKYGPHLLPLYHSRVVEQDILDFWGKQPFDLKLSHDPVLGTYEGNCDFCFLKKSAKIKRLALEQPENLVWWTEQEDKTGATFRKDRYTYNDLLYGRVPLDVCSTEGDQQDIACFCTE